MTDEEQLDARNRLRRALGSGGPAFPTPPQSSSTGMTVRDKAAMDFASAQIMTSGFDKLEAAHLMQQAYEFANAFIEERKRWHGE